MFDLEPDNVRVISHYLGGGFGCKGSAWSHVALAVMAAKVTQRPVKVVLARQQMFAFVGHRPRTVQKLALGADAAGKIVAMKHETLSHTSQFDDFSEPSGLVSRTLYASDNITTTHRIVRLDLGTPTFTRASGETTGTHALESAMDELAVAMDIDPVKRRLDNYADKDPDDGKP